MTASIQVDVAVGIVTELTSHSFSQSFTPRRQLGELDVNLKELNTLVVDVVPFKLTSRLANRGAIAYTCVTSIVIRKKFPANTLVSGRIPLTQTDGLMSLMQEIHDYFTVSQQIPRTGRRLASVPEAVWMEHEEKNEDGIIGPYSKYLNEEQTFVGIIRVTYEVHRTPV